MLLRVVAEVQPPGGVSHCVQERNAAGQKRAEQKHRSILLVY